MLGRRRTVPFLGASGRFFLLLGSARTFHHSRFYLHFQRRTEVCSRVTFPHFHRRRFSTFHRRALPRFLTDNSLQPSSPFLCWERRDVFILGHDLRIPCTIPGFTSRISGFLTFTWTQHDFFILGPFPRSCAQFRNFGSFPCARFPRFPRRLRDGTSMSAHP